MKNALLTATLVACALSAPIVSAQEKSAPAKPAMKADMPNQMSQMQDTMKEMQQQMEKIRATSDPKEREKLLQAHMRTMQDSMKAMRGAGEPTMDSGQGGKMMEGKKVGMTSGDMMKRQETMEKRMDMMQMMMEQMMQRDQAMYPLPAK